MNSLPQTTSPETPGGGDAGSRMYMMMVVCVATVGGFLFGYDVLIMSGAMIFIQQEFSLNPSALGFSVSIISLGTMVGAFTAGWLSDRLGRKKTLILAASLFMLSAVGTAFPPNVEIFNLFRFVGGMGMGVAMVTSPVYIAEISPARIRGTLVTFNQFVTVFGSIVAFLVSWRLAADGNWRAMMGSVAAPSMGLLVGLAFVPESPRWLVGRGRRDEARDILAKISGSSRAETEVAEIADSIEEEKRMEHGSWSELFRPGGIRIALIVAIGLAVLQQFSGGLPLTLYAPKIFMAAGFPDPQEAIGISVLIQCWSLLCVVVALLLVERVGRKPLLLVGVSAMALGHLVLALFFLKGTVGPIVPAVLILTTGMSNISISPMAWVILAEIFPTRLRGKGMAVATFCLFLASFGVTQLFPVADDYFKSHYGNPSGVFLLFAIICAVGVAWMAWMVPETKGKTLEEIASYWLHKGKAPGGRIA